MCVCVCVCVEGGGGGAVLIGNEDANFQGGLGACSLGLPWTAFCTISSWSKEI